MAEVTGQAGNGLVQVTMTASGDVRGVRIDPKVVDPDDVDTDAFGRALRAIESARRDGRMTVLERDVLHDFHAMWPEKFSNKTNGVTFRRWLHRANIDRGHAPGRPLDVGEQRPVRPVQLAVLVLQRLHPLVEHRHQDLGGR